MVVGRLISSHMNFVTLNFSFKFYTFLWAFDKYKFLMLKFLDARRYVRCLHFPLASTMFELSFSARGTAYWSATQVHLTHCVVKARIDANLKKEAISRIANLSREIFHVFNRMLAKYLRLFYSVLIARFLAFISTYDCISAHDHVVLKYLSM